MFAYLNMGGMEYANKISLSKTLAASYARQEGRQLPLTKVRGL